IFWGDVNYPLLPSERSFYLELNYRHAYFEKAGLDLNQVFAKHQSTWYTKHKDLLNLYINRFNKIWVSHIYSSEYALELINNGYLSNELRDWAEEQELMFYKVATLSLNAIAAQINSASFRPIEIIRPWQSSNESLIAVDSSKDWILLAHFEDEYKAINYSELVLAKNIGGITFSGRTTDNSPYSGYRLHPTVIWDNVPIAIEIEETPTVAFIHQDPIEFLRLLWLNPNLAQALNLTTSDPADGLYATNENNEKVLKLESWALEYLGLNSNNSLHDEMPKLTGSALFLRRDYFDNLCELYNHTPKYYTRSFKSQDASELD
ncbi:hypothetical protein, partial [Taibaiella soli]